MSLCAIGPSWQLWRTLSARHTDRNSCTILCSSRGTPTLRTCSIKSCNVPFYEEEAITSSVWPNISKLLWNWLMGSKVIAFTHWLGNMGRGEMQFQWSYWSSEKYLWSLSPPGAQHWGDPRVCVLLSRSGQPLVAQAVELIFSSTDKNIRILKIHGCSLTHPSRHSQEHMNVHLCLPDQHRRNL